MLNRFSHLGFVFFEDMNVDIRGDFSIAMTEVFGNCREGAENGEVFAIAKVKLQAVKFVLRTSEVKFAHFAEGKTSLTP